MSTYRTKPVVKASGRRLNTIENSHEKLSIDRRIYLPFDLATVHAAAQNFRIDLAKGVHCRVDEWEITKSSYLEEALRLLKDDGCNLYPGHNNEFWIHTERARGFVQMPSERARMLLELFDYWFALDDVELLKDEDFPCPTKVNSNMSIEKATCDFDRRFVYN